MPDDHGAVDELLQRLRLATSVAGVGVWEWLLDTDEMIYSDEARSILGFPPGAPLTIEMVVAATHPDDLTRTTAQGRRARDPATRDTEPFEYRVVRPDGEVRWVYAKGEAIFGERNGRQEALRYLGVIQDITERKQAQDLLKASEARLRVAMEAGRMAVWEGGPGEEVIPTPELLRLLGFPEGASPTRRQIRAGFQPGEREQMMGAAAAAFARGERSMEFEFQYRQPDGDLRWFLIRADMRTDSKGELAGSIGVLVDITERKRAEERAQLLAQEVDHRANNLLTVVQGVVALSKANGDGALRNVILGRLEAIAQAHKLLAESRWQGADLRTLLFEELEAFQAQDVNRVTLDGPPVALSPSEAQALAMTVHELTTNAAKHGALSTDKGSVSVRWRKRPDGGVEINWEESGGPSVEPPKRVGFGSVLIERAVVGLPEAQARIDYETAGRGVPYPIRSAASLFGRWKQRISAAVGPAGRTST